MSDTSYKPKSFTHPNTTQVPNILIDFLMQDFTGAELKVILFLIRRTYGFGKDDDAVSLSQLLQGMKERGTGRILNKGTGLTKKTLLQALTNLESQGHVIREQRRSDERGNEPTVYRLNIQIASLLELEAGAGEQSELEKSTPPLGEKLHQGGGVKVPPSPRGKNSPTQNQRLQNQREQQHGGVVEDLTDFGMTETVARKLAEQYPEEELLEKLDLVCWLVETRSPLVGKNPAGYLRRAIEEDYAAPRQYKSPAERKAEQQRKQELQAQAEATIEADQNRRAKELELERERKEQALKAFRKEHPAAQISGTALTTETTWQMVLEQLKTTMNGPNYSTWLAETILTSCDRSTAIVVAPSSFVADWLRNRFTPLIRKSLTDVLGFSVELEILALTELEADRERPSTDQHVLSPPAPTSTSVS